MNDMGSSSRCFAPNVSPIAPGDWRRFICVENGTMKRERA